MKALITILIIVAIVAIAALIWMSIKRKRDQQNRVRADELRSQAATTAHEHDEQALRAREAEAEAERARAQAEKADLRAQEERLAKEQAGARHEDHLREADRLDPDVNHRAEDYQPRVDENGTARGAGVAGGPAGVEQPPRSAIPNEGPAGGPTTGEHVGDAEPRTWSERSDRDPEGRHQA